MKVKLGIRLYRAHDLDLISLMEEYEFNFTKALYCAITAFVNGETFVVKDLELRYTPKSYKKKSILRVLTLNEEKDKKAILFLEGIEKGYRNSFLKNLLRLYLCRPIASAYFGSEQDAMEAEAMCEIFKEHRKVARAANFSKTTGRSLEGRRLDKTQRAEGNTYSAESYSKQEGRKPYITPVSLGKTGRPEESTRSAEAPSRPRDKKPYKTGNVGNQREAYSPKGAVYSELSSNLSGNSSESRRESVDGNKNTSSLSGYPSEGRTSESKSRESSSTSSLSGLASYPNEAQVNGNEISLHGDRKPQDDETELLNAFMGML